MSVPTDRIMIERALSRDGESACGWMGKRVVKEQSASNKICGMG